MPDDLPNIDRKMFAPPDIAALRPPFAAHGPRILLLYGSLRERSFSRFLTMEAARLLEALGAETRVFNSSGLPLADDAPVSHPKVQELRDLSAWSEGQVWCSPERHGAMTGIMKTQIDWIPLALGAVRPTQGKTLAVMQVSGGSQSFNAINQMRVLGRWMRMITIPNQSSVAKAFEQFGDTGRMKPSAYYDRVVDVMEELMKFTLLTRNASAYLTNRYSERKESAAQATARRRVKSALTGPSASAQTVQRARRRKAVGRRADGGLEAAQGFTGFATEIAVGLTLVEAALGQQLLQFKTLVARQHTLLPRPLSHERRAAAQAVRKVADGERIRLGRIVAHDGAEVSEHQEARPVRTSRCEQECLVAGARKRLAAGTLDAEMLPLRDAVVLARSAWR